MTTHIEQADEAEVAAFNEWPDAPSWKDDPESRDAAIRWHMRGFEAGAQWQSTRPEPPVTEEEVEAAARTMFDAPDGVIAEYSWAEMVAEDPSRADIWRADARAVLEAARATREGKNQ